MDNSEYHLASLVVQRVFDRAAGTYSQASAVQREIAQRLLDRLDYLRIEPQLVLDLGCGAGAELEPLRTRFPKARVVGFDLSEGMLHRARSRGRWFRRPVLAAANASALPLRDNSADLIFSNLMLPWCSDQESVWAELRRVLRPGGAVLFTTLGPDTLYELRSASSAVDDEMPHVHAFIDMHDIGDALLRHGIADPVMDAEHIRVEYSSLSALITELQRTGSVNINAGRRRGLGRRMSVAALEAHYPVDTRSGRFVATVEVIYGHGWAVEADRSGSDHTEVFVPLSSLRRKVSGT